MSAQSSGSPLAYAIITATQFVAAFGMLWLSAEAWSCSPLLSILCALNGAACVVYGIVGTMGFMEAISDA